MNAFQQTVERSLFEGMAHGVVVRVGREGKVLIDEAFGLARSEPAVAMRQDSIFDVASLTKVVATATAAAICVDDGKLDVEAPIEEYLPGIRTAGCGIRVRDLASHMSGYDNAKAYYEAFLAGEDPVRAILREPPARPAGTEYQYACINMMLVGLAVEMVSGLRLDAFCQKRIFGPLGMRETRFGPVDGADLRVVEMQNRKPGAIADEPAHAAGRPLGNAGLFTTTADLAVFAETLLGGGQRAGVRILSPGAVKLLQHRLTPSGARPRSFGWDLGEDLRPARLSPQTCYHGGYTGQSLYVDAASGTHIVVLSNRRCENELSKNYRRNIADAALAVL